MERKSGSDAWNRARTEILLSGTATWNRSLEQSWNVNLREHRRTERTEHETEVDILHRTVSRLY